MHKLANTLNLLIAVALLCLGSARARADTPPMPPAVLCPAQGGATEQTLNNAVCTDKALEQLAGEAQHLYYTHFALRPEEARELRYTWRTNHIVCIGHRLLPSRMADCIREQLMQFMYELHPRLWRHSSDAFSTSPEVQFNITHRRQSERVREARDSLAKCSAYHVTQLDDGASPAREIAVAAAYACRREVEKTATQLVVREELERPFMEMFFTSRVEASVAAQLSDPDLLIPGILRVREEKVAQAAGSAGRPQPSGARKDTVQSGNERETIGAPQRSTNQAIRLVVSSQDSEGVTQQNFNLQFLRNLEAHTVERVKTLTKEYFASRGYPNADVRLTSEATYVQSGPTKLAVIRLRSSDGSNQIFIAGIVGDELKRIACVRDSPETIPISYGVCAEKVHEVFGVRIGQ